MDFVLCITKVVVTARCNQRERGGGRGRLGCPSCDVCAVFYLLFSVLHLHPQSMCFCCDLPFGVTVKIIAAPRNRRVHTHARAPYLSLSLSLQQSRHTEQRAIQKIVFPRLIATHAHTYQLPAIAPAHIFAR